MRLQIPLPFVLQGLAYVLVRSAIYLIQIFGISDKILIRHNQYSAHQPVSIDLIV